MQTTTGLLDEGPKSLHSPSLAANGPFHVSRVIGACLAMRGYARRVAQRNQARHWPTLGDASAPLLLQPVPAVATNRQKGSRCLTTVAPMRPTRLGSGIWTRRRSGR